MDAQTLQKMLEETRKLLLINPVRNRKRLRQLASLEATILNNADKFDSMNALERAIIYARVDALRFMAFINNRGDLN